MSGVPKHANPDGLPVVWAGRLADRVAGANLPSDYLVLGEHDTLPYEPPRALDRRTNVLVVLDLLSFPFEDMADHYWEIPMVVVLPSGSELSNLTTTFGPILFERLGFFDHVVTPDSALWEELRRAYRWADSQRIPVVSDDPGKVAVAVCNLFESAPVPSNLRFSKAMHGVQAAALEPWFSAPRGRWHAKGPLDVLEVGAGAGRWASRFDPMEARFVGIDTRADLVKAARANFPDQRFDHLGADLQFPYDDASFDVVFSVTAMQNNPEATRRTLLSEMWRAARAGGRLLFLEDFVSTRKPVTTSTFPVSVTKFVDLILDATDGQVVLEYVESLRYPDEDLYRGGLISLLKLGIPET
jgi:SAM-dependent methyltransferase